MKALALALGLAMAAPVAMADVDQDRRGRTGIVKAANVVAKEAQQLAQQARKTARVAQRPAVKKKYRQLAQKARKAAVEARQLAVTGRKFNRGNVGPRALRVALRQLKKAKNATGVAFQAIPPRAKRQNIVREARQFNRAFIKLERTVKKALPNRRVRR